jgi:galactose oxidase
MPQCPQKRPHFWAVRALLPVLVFLLFSCSDGFNALSPGGSGEEEAAAFADHTSKAVSPMSGTVGQWTTQFPWVNVAVHLSLLPDGRVLSFGRLNGGTPQVWDPATGSFIGIPSPSLLFCAGMSYLPAGKLFVAGGHIADGLGLPNSNVFNFRTNSWTAGPDMANGRWYPTATMLANGEVLVIAGSDQNGNTVMVPEVRMTNGNWRQLNGASRSLPYFPRDFLAPNGEVFYAGQMQATSYLNTTGAGSWTFVANRVVADRSYGAAVMYRPGKIIYAGGGDPPTSTAEVIDLNVPSPQWQATSSMAHARRHLNLTLLPDGRVLAMGGTSSPGFTDPAGAIHETEVWDPTTGQWTPWSSNAVTRVYHSTAVLLPDGRLVFAGSGDGANLPDEQNAEIFEPPYLFNGPRPTITAVSAQWRYGSKVVITTPDAASIAKVSLLRLNSTTHAFDMNQRFIALNFTRQAGSITAALPTSKTRIPTGHYMVFILNGTGVPSVARIIWIG